MMRIAFFTPLNPQRSGVSDYSEDLLPHLARHVEIDVVVDTAAVARANRGLTCCAVISAAEFKARRSHYDECVYQIANSSDHHGYMLPFLARHPGVAVLHDYCLHYLALGTTALRGDLRALERLLIPQVGLRQARATALRLLLSTQDPFELSFARPVVESSAEVIVHSAHARDLVLGDVPDARVTVIPMGVPAAAPVSDIHALRRRHGFAQDDFVIVSVSTLSYTKRLELVLRALHRLRQNHPGARLVIVGGGPLGSAARRLISQLDLHDAVRHTGWVPASTYRDIIALADVAVDVRYPSGAETSASLLRCLALGTPAVVSAQGPYVELPDSCCVRIPVAPGEAEELTAALTRLSQDRARIAAMSLAAREYVRDRHGLEQAASGYVRVLERAAGLPREAGVDHYHGRAGAGAPIVAAVYKTFRLIDLGRKYGVVDAALRLRERVRASTATSTPKEETS